MPSVHWAHPWSQEMPGENESSPWDLPKLGPLDGHGFVKSCPAVASEKVLSWPTSFRSLVDQTRPFSPKDTVVPIPTAKLWQVVPRCACRASRGQMLGNRGVTVRQQRQLVVRKSVQQKAGSTFASGMMMITVIIIAIIVVVIIKLILIWTLCTHVDNTKT